DRRAPHSLPTRRSSDLHRGQSLAELWDTLGSAWASVTSGMPWAGESTEKYDERLAKWEVDRAANWVGSRRRPRPLRRIGLREEYGILGFVRAFEATHGKAGWHPHFHIILVLSGSVPADDICVLGKKMFERWSRKIRARGYEVERGVGLDIRSTAGAVKNELARYLSKSLAAEASYGHAKQGRSENLTPFQLL